MQEAPGPAREQALRLEINTIKQLVERHDARSKQLLHRERLLLIADHVNGRPGSSLNEVGRRPKTLSPKLYTQPELGRRPKP